jgi:autotransporter-associated beta strand protein
VFHRSTSALPRLCLEGPVNNHIFFLSTMAALSLVLLSATRLYADDWSPLWTTTHLSQPREELAATSAGGKVFFAGGENGGVSSNVVDIYDLTTGLWSVAHLSQARNYLAATSVGSKVFFGGGISQATGALSDTVDIFDTNTNTWSSARLSKARTTLCAASVGDKVLFSGGWETKGTSNVVDIYDSATDIWSTASLSQARGSFAAASTEGKAYFGGGNPYSNRVDVFDSTTNTWSTASLSQARQGLAAASADGKVLFAGGYNGDYVNTVDVLDTATGLWSTAQLSQGRAFLAAASVGNKILVAGGNIKSGPTFYNTVDIYDAATGIWSTDTLSQARNNLTATSAGNKVFFAGGNNTGTSPRSDVVDIYTLQTYPSISSAKPFKLVDQTTVTGRMQLNAGASLDLDGYNLTVGSMGGVAPISLSTHTLTVGADNSDSAYSGAIGGSGALVKTGSGVLSLSGVNSYLGLTTIYTGKVDLIGPDAWNPITNLGGAYLVGGELVFDYSGAANPYATILDLLYTKINGSMPLTVADDTVNNRVTVSLAVPEPSSFVLAATGLVTLFACSWRRKSKNVNRLPTR